jgi:heme-degrading monooxygenase HmoA
MDKEFAVIFRTKRSLPVPAEYAELSKKLVELLKEQTGFRRIESVADADGNGISVSYWDSLDSIKAWKENSLHLEAQDKGKMVWYHDYVVEICEVIRSYRKRSK